MQIYERFAIISAIKFPDAHIEDQNAVHNTPTLHDALVVK
jgi:hypothetical protein